MRHVRTVRAAFLVSATFSGRSPLGCPRHSARTRITRRLHGVATPALVGVAAAFAVASTPASAQSATQAPGRHVADTRAAGQPAATPAWLASLALPAATVRPAARRHAALAAKYTVRHGDTLSVIAKRLYQSPDYWPVLYWANHRQIRYANQIQAGQVLAVPVKPRKIPSPPSALGPAPAPAPGTTAATTHYGTYAPASSATSAPAHTASTYAGGSGSYQACVIARESGGNSQVMNSSGHYGLYQFSASTWAAYGGNPADFGNASVAEQNQVFNSAIAAGGQSNWSPYDGC
jgi:LysM repeat protein